MPKEKKLEIKGQPQSIEAEQAVLGSMLSTKEAVSKAIQQSIQRTISSEDLEEKAKWLKGMNFASRPSATCEWQCEASDICSSVHGHTSKWK